jgi:hypothetical protein
LWVGLWNTGERADRAFNALSLSRIAGLLDRASGSVERWEKPAPSLACQRATAPIGAKIVFRVLIDRWAAGPIVDQSD